MGASFGAGLDASKHKNALCLLVQDNMCCCAAGEVIRNQREKCCYAATMPSDLKKRIQLL